MKILGILNITEDSFSDGGKFLAADAALAHGEALLKDGASGKQAVRALVQETRLCDWQVRKIVNRPQAADAGSAVEMTDAQQLQLFNLF